MPKENVDLLTRQTKIYNFAASMHWIPLLGQVEDETVNCFKKWGGVLSSIFILQKVGASDPMAFSIESHKKQYMDMLCAIENNVEPLVNGMEGRKSVEVVKSIYESWKINLPVKLGK